MIFEKQEKKTGINPSRALPKTRHPVINEVRRLLFLAIASALLLALLSYSPSDPSLSTWSSRGEIQNWMGRLGSILSDMLLQFLGLGAFGTSLVLGLSALPKKDEEETNAPISRHLWAMPPVMTFSFCALLQALYPPEWMPWGLKNPGGLLGNFTLSGFEYLGGRTGALLVASCWLICSTMIFFRVQLLTKTKEFLSTTLPKWIAGAKRVIAEKWARGLSAVKDRFAKKVTEAPPLPAALLAQAAAAEAADEAPAAQTASMDEDTGTSRDLDELSRMVGSSKLPKEKAGSKVVARAGRNKSFQLPSLNMLSGKAESKTKTVDKNWYVEKASILVQKLKDFGVDGEVVNISPGPVITVYEFKPASGVKIKEIANLSDDLTLALSVLSVRIVAPIPGKPVVGIEIPSPHRETVFFKDMIQETPFFSGDIRIPVVLGRLASGEPVAADLASMPHLLVAGTTGTGKSVFINTLISSLIYRFTPQQLKLILVDPKMVELSHYEGIPHLLLPVVVDSKKAVLALRWAVEEMERRYTKMHQFSVRHIDGYNERLGEMGSKVNPPANAEEHSFMPYIVVVIDEYADLMAVVPKDVELSIARLAQKARASGIHLVLATQRPSTDVVTGTIKANFPSRISFRVASSVDSKTILDRTGADRLLGQGDMLFHSAGFSSLKRMQGSFISDSDTGRVVEFLKSQGEPEYNEKILEPLENGTFELEGESGSSSGGADENALYDAAVRLVTEKGEASISLIQRHLKIGYNRAASLMEEMEKEGVVAQSTSNSKRRAVLVNSL